MQTGSSGFSGRFLSFYLLIITGLSFRLYISILDYFYLRAAPKNYKLCSGIKIKNAKIINKQIIAKYSFDFHVLKRKTYDIITVFKLFRIHCLPRDMKFYRSDFPHNT